MLDSKELLFLEFYESKMKEYQLLKLLEDNLTEQGKSTLKHIEKYLLEKLDKYFELSGSRS